MIVAKIRVDGVWARAEYRKLITAGIIGAQVQINYAPDVWQGLHKTVVFKGAVTKDVITDAETVTIPAEVVAKRGVVLRVGVYGVDADGNIAIPTLWADLGTIRDAADPSGDATTDPSLPVWAQVQADVQRLKEHGLDVNAETIGALVEAYLEENPPAGGLTEIPIATDKAVGGIKVGDNLLISDDGVLSVKTATAVEADNTLPITSAAVNTTVGNIEILLATI